MKTQVNQELVNKYSLYQGLNKLECHFLREEMKDNFKLPTSILRRNAKKRAFQQKIKWFFQETTVVFVMAATFALFIACFIIWSL
jgi:hypothetical protein